MFLQCFTVFKCFAMFSQPEASPEKLKIANKPVSGLSTMSGWCCVVSQVFGMFSLVFAMLFSYAFVFWAVHQVQKRGLIGRLWALQGVTGSFPRNFAREIDGKLPGKQGNTHPKTIPEAPSEKLELASKPVSVLLSWVVGILVVCYVFLGLFYLFRGVVTFLQPGSKLTSDVLLPPFPPNTL